MISALILLSTVTQVTVCKCIIVYLIIIIALTVPVTINTGLQISITPSPNITTLQSAVFSCTVDVAVPISWTINETSSINIAVFQSYISSYGIVADGLDTQDTTLTIPGDPVLNGTVVQCSAVEIMNNELTYYEVDSDTLYIQGMGQLLYVMCSSLSDRSTS